LSYCLSSARLTACGSCALIRSLDPGCDEVCLEWGFDNAVVPAFGLLAIAQAAMRYSRENVEKR
jgi:hypothetical protein